MCIVYWDLGLGGIQKRIRDAATDISRHYDGWDVYILLRRKLHEGFDSQIDGKRRVILRYYPYAGFIRPPLGYIFWIVWQYIVIKPDTVLTFQCMLSSLLALCKYAFFWIPMKLVLNEGAVTSQALRWEKLSYLGFLIRFMYPLADVIIVPTQACKVDLVRNYLLSEKKISVIPNWTLFPPIKPLASRYDLVFVGRFSPEKNPLFMIPLAKALLSKHLRLRVGMIGHGSLRSRLIEVMNQEKLEQHIQVMPFSQNIRSLLRHSKILVVPSHNEGMPNVVLEAAMCQVPAVTHHFSGVEEVVGHGRTGYISETSEEAATYIDGLLRYEQRRQFVGKQAQKFVMARFGHTAQQRFIATLLS